MNRNLTTYKSSNSKACKGVLAYRFSFNGQEKDDEIYGEGNALSATFWEYDARIGRRWNLDPKPNPAISWYSCFENNPIWLSDLLGDTVKNGHQKQFDESQKKYSEAKNNFTAKYGDPNNKLKKENFNSKDEWVAYKKDRKDFKKIQNQFNAVKRNYEFVQKYIEKYKQIDPTGFDIMDNLVIDSTSKNIIITAGEPIDAVASTQFQAYKENDRTGIAGDISIYISNNVSIMSNVLAHEFGHILKMIKDPWKYSKMIQSNPNHNCQENPNSEISKEAIFWQRHWDKLINIK